MNLELVYTYTRAQAVADGLQVEVTKTAQEAGIRFPMFITRAVYTANGDSPRSNRLSASFALPS